VGSVVAKRGWQENPLLKMKVVIYDLFLRPATESTVIWGRIGSGEHANCTVRDAHCWHGNGHLLGQPHLKYAPTAAFLALLKLSVTPRPAAASSARASTRRTRLYSKRARGIASRVAAEAAILSRVSSAAPSLVM